MAQHRSGWSSISAENRFWVGTNNTGSGPSVLSLLAWAKWRIALNLLGHAGFAKWLFSRFGAIRVNLDFNVYTNRDEGTNVVFGEDKNQLDHLP